MKDHPPLCDVHPPPPSKSKFCELHEKENSSGEQEVDSNASILRLHPRFITLEGKDNDEMVFGSVISSPRGNLSLQQALELANIYLDHAGKAQDVDISLVFCHDTEVSLLQAGKAAKHVHDQTMRYEIATGYIRLGRVLAIRGYRSEAQAIYKKAEKLG